MSTEYSLNACGLVTASHVLMFFSTYIVDLLRLLFSYCATIAGGPTYVVYL